MKVMKYVRWTKQPHENWLVDDCNHVWSKN